jgi:IS5 family transposase
MHLETMLRIYFLENWYAMSDPMAEETLYASEAMRRFAGIELDDDCIPDETNILNFWHLLERRGLTEAIFADMHARIADKGITLRSGEWDDRGPQNLPLSAGRSAGGTTKSGLVRRLHLPADAPWIPLSRRQHGLVHSQGLGLADIERAGGRLLR